MEKQAAQKAGLKPMARLVSYGLAGVDPKIMGIGPVLAVQNALKRAGLKVEDMDVIESNEAFAVQALAVSCDLKFAPKKTHPNGGAVGLGHPIGATGALLTVKALLRYVSNHDFTIFAWYRIIFGIFVLLTAYFGWVEWSEP